MEWKHGFAFVGFYNPHPFRVETRISHHWLQESIYNLLQILRYKNNTRFQFIGLFI